jgi:hypothetical protein
MVVQDVKRAVRFNVLQRREEHVPEEYDAENKATGQMQTPCRKERQCA